MARDSKDREYLAAALDQVVVGMSHRSPQVWAREIERCAQKLGRLADRRK